MIAQHLVQSLEHRGHLIHVYGMDEVFPQVPRTHMSHFSFPFSYPEFHFPKGSTLPHFMGWKMNLEEKAGISFIVQWLRIHLSMQGMQIQSLVGKRDPICYRATKPKRCNQRKSGCCSKAPVQTKKRKKTEKKKDFHMIVTECLSKWEKLLKSWNKGQNPLKSVVWDDLRD